MVGEREASGVAVPGFIFHIVSGILFCLARLCSLDQSCGYSSPYLSVAYMGALGYYGTGRNDGSSADNSVVKYHCSHTYQAATTQGAAVDGGVVAYGNPILDEGRCGAAHVDAYTILHVDSMPHGNGGHVGADDGPKPHGAVITHGDSAYDGGILAEVAAVAPAGRLMVD